MWSCLNKSCSVRCQGSSEYEGGTCVGYPITFIDLTIKSWSLLGPLTISLESWRLDGIGVIHDLYKPMHGYFWIPRQWNFTVNFTLETEILSPRNLCSIGIKFVIQAVPGINFRTIRWLEKFWQLGCHEYHTSFIPP